MNEGFVLSVKNIFTLICSFINSPNRNRKKKITKINKFFSYNNVSESITISSLNVYCLSSIKSDQIKFTFTFFNSMWKYFKYICIYKNL